jgi:hypothetical protein
MYRCFFSARSAAFLQKPFINVVGVGKYMSFDAAEMMNGHIVVNLPPLNSTDTTAEIPCNRFP